MAEIQGLTHLAFRGVLDSLEENLGVNGKNAILRYIGFESFITNPPDYDGEKRMAPEDNKTVWMGVREIIGNNGYNSLLYRAGIFLINKVLSMSQPLQAVVALEQEPIEKLKTIYSAYLYNIGLVPEQDLEIHTDKNLIVIHRAQCNECEYVIKNPENLKGIMRPGCAFVQGGVFQVGNLRQDLYKVTSVSEETCRLLGADECLFHAKYELIKK